MYFNFEGLEPGEDMYQKNIFLVLPDPFGALNQKNLCLTLIYQFEHFGTPYITCKIYLNASSEAITIL